MGHDDGPVAAFASALRTLRHDSGDPTYAALAQRTGLSPSTLSEAARGRRLPRWSTVEAFVQACGGDPDQWRPSWEAAAQQTVPGKASSPPAPPATAPGPETASAAGRGRRWHRLLPAVGLPLAIAVTLGILFTNAHTSAGSPGRPARDTSGWVRVIGPGCPAGTDGAQVSVDKGWSPAGSGWTYDGCDGRSVTTSLFDSTTQWNLTVGWSFEPYDSGAPATCRLDVYVPASIDATGTATYRVLGKNVDGPPIKEWIPVPQAAHRGSWVTLGTFRFPQGIVNLELFNIGNGTAHIAGDAARATCN